MSLEKGNSIKETRMLKQTDKQLRCNEESMLDKVCYKGRQ